MQQFTVPQFIDVEDKVIGPLSVRQFIIVLATFGLVAISYKVFDFTMFTAVAVITLLLGGTFAFIKINGAPFHNFLLNIIQTLRKPQLRVWSKGWEKATEEEVAVPVFQEAPQPRRYSMSHLNRLSLIVDTRGYYSGEDEEADIQAVANNQLPT